MRLFNLLTRRLRPSRRKRFNGRRVKSFEKKRQRTNKCSTSGGEHREGHPSREGREQCSPPSPVREGQGERSLREWELPMMPAKRYSDPTLTRGCRTVHYGYISAILEGWGTSEGEPITRSELPAEVRASTTPLTVTYRYIMSVLLVYPFFQGARLAVSLG